MPFNDEELENFRKKLISKKYDILKDVGFFKEGMHNEGSLDEHTHAHHFADVASITEDQINSAALMNHEIRMINEIDEALDRIDKKTYGICECGSEISYGRLKVKPEAKYCIKCRHLKEKYGEI